ncbi:hypothetical protein Tco_0786373 [Tanacetum coccineum]
MLMILQDLRSRYIKTFTKMVSRFDRLDFIELHSLVMRRFSTRTPEGIDLVLWGDLRIMFEETTNDDIWKNQEKWINKSWTLYENCRVHILALEDGTEIHMLAERRHQELASPEANGFCKELASPKQTALGKDILNPLIVDSLLKTIWLSVHHVIAMKHWLFQSKWLLLSNLYIQDEYQPAVVVAWYLDIVKAQGLEMYEADPNCTLNVMLYRRSKSKFYVRFYRALSIALYVIGFHVKPTTNGFFTGEIENLDLLQESKLSTVCKKVFDKCLAPDYGSEGCNNMTMILAQFNKWPRHVPSTSGQSSPYQPSELLTAKKYLNQLSDEPTLRILNGTAGGIFFYKSPNQAFQFLDDKVLFKLDWSIKSQNKHHQKSVAFVNGSNSNNDNSGLLEKLKALTIKMDS